MADLVKMVRDDGKTADVHPEMVSEYIKGNYRVAEEQPEAPKRGRPRKGE